jgi:hypothetical protein
LDQHGGFIHPAIVKGQGKLDKIPDRYYEMYETAAKNRTAGA